MRRPISTLVFIAAVSTTACGESSPPVLSNFVIDTSPVVRGQQANGSFEIGDNDGLGGITASGKLSGPVAGDVPIALVGLTDALTEAHVAFAILLTTQIPVGDYQLKITAKDPDANESNEAMVSFTAQ